MSKNISETILRDLGLKVTGPRLKVLQILQQSQHKHYSAEAIYEALKLNQIDIGMASVYRILTQFETLGLVKKHNFEDGRFVYELGSQEHHDHMVCLDCGQVIEFLDTLIEERQRNLASHHEFKMTDHVLVIYGHCKNCH